MRKTSMASFICIPLMAFIAGCGGGNSNNGGGGGGGNNPLVLNFGTAKTFAAGQIPANWQTITSGDFDGDGFADIAVANGSDNNVGVFLNDGAGSFAAQVPNTTGGNP
ncbi:MAG: VCBS repeat-containing protein, partial [Deltaproteobacteria bacterium]|nr:VCBS repeat-containing protein [Deltaproteobacteria bacterium]